MTDKEVIQAIIKLFEKEERFTRTFMARDKCGNEVSPTDPKAFCFCIVGALRHFQASDTLQKTLETQSLKASGGLMPLTTLNDYGGLNMVRNLLTQTLEILC